MPVSNQISRGTKAPSPALLASLLHIYYTIGRPCLKGAALIPALTKVTLLCTQMLACVLTQTLREGTLYPQAASQVTGSGWQLKRLCLERGRRLGSWWTRGSPMSPRLLSLCRHERAETRKGGCYGSRGVVLPLSALFFMALHQKIIKYSDTECSLSKQKHM